MPIPNMTKHVYNIRCSNGAVVNNLQIYGKTEEESRAKLMQMYRNCDVLNVSTAASSSKKLTTDYEDVLERIIGSY